MTEREDLDPLLPSALELIVAVVGVGLLLAVAALVLWLVLRGRDRFGDRSPRAGR